jgi:hypothetical protein
MRNLDLKTIIQHDYKGGTVGEERDNRLEGKGDGDGGIIEVHFRCMYENHVMKLTKTLKKEGRKRGVKKSNIHKAN